MDAIDLYAAKCYWPDATEAHVASGLLTLRAMATRRALHADRLTGAPNAESRGALFFPLDGLALCVFEAASAGDVKRASEQVGLPCERVMQAVWLSD